jgi:hypothetical protein
MDDNDTDDPEPETRSPRSVVVTASAAELGIELEAHDPIMADVDDVSMPRFDDEDEE